MERLVQRIIKEELAIRHRTYRSMTDEMLKRFSVHHLSDKEIEEISEVLRKEYRQDLINLISIFRLENKIFHLRREG